MTNTMQVAAHTCTNHTHRSELKGDLRVGHSQHQLEPQPPHPPVLVGDADPYGGPGLAPGLVDQGGRHHVLDPGPRVAARDSHLGEAGYTLVTLVPTRHLFNLNT